jgi:ferritin-like metal-binding protein YciE
MKTPKSNTETRHSTGAHAASGAGKKAMQSSALMELFEEELKHIYWAEKALANSIPKMVKKATSRELVDALTGHLEETKEHVRRVERVFESFGNKATAVKCDAMEGLIEEAEHIMEECEKGAMCDAGIISAAQKIEHYEIASYGTLRQFAETLKLSEAIRLLEETLEEEKASDSLLTDVAITAVNIEAATEKA